MVKERRASADGYQRIRLFRAAFQPGLVEIDENGFEKETTLQNIVEQNISYLFPELEVLDKQFQRDGHRPDTVAFDCGKNTFVIIEYKRRKDTGALDQATSYLAHMDKHKDSFIRLYERKRQIQRDQSYFDWRGAYALVVSPEFTPKQIEAGEYYDHMKLYRVALYGSNIISMERVDGDEKRRASTKPDEPKPMPPGQPYKIFSARLLGAFPNMTRGKRKLYDRFSRDGQLLCTMAPQKARTWLYYSISKDNPSPSQGKFIVFEKHPGVGLGHWRSEIKSEADFERALDILKRIVYAGVPRKPEVREETGPTFGLDVMGHTRHGSEMSIPDVKHVKGMAYPTELLCPDKSKKHLGSWADMLDAVADWLVSKKYIDRTHCPVQIGLETAILNTKAVHQNGKPFSHYRKVGKFYVNTNFSSQNILRHACRLIEVAGQKPSDFKLYFKDSGHTDP